MREKAVLLFVLGTAAFGQQPNTAIASLVVDGATGPPYPIVGPSNAGVPIRTNLAAVAAVGGAPGAPLILALSSTGNVQTNATTLLGGIVDIPLSPPVAVWVDGFQAPGAGVYQTGPSGSYLLSFVPSPSVAINTTFALQGAVHSPFQPPPYQAALTAATKVVVTPGPVVTTYSLGDGGTVTQALTGWTFPFYGVAHSTLFTKADGYMNMGSVVSDFSSSPGLMTFGPPRIAAFWADMAQGPGFTKTTLDDAPPAGVLPSYKVEFVNVIDWSHPIGASHTFSWVVDSSGLVKMSVAATNQASAFETMTCLEPGSNTGVGGILDLSLLQDSGGLVGGLNGRFYEWFGLVTMPSYTLGVNRPFDLAGRTLTFVPNYVEPTGPTSLVQSTKAYSMF
jgi:hypothetical protein